MGQRKKKNRKRSIILRKLNLERLQRFWSIVISKEGLFNGGKLEKEYAASRSFKKTLREKIEKETRVANENDETYSNSELNMLLGIYGTDDNLSP